MDNLELVFPKELKAEKETPSYGKFIAEPFESGYGHTIGNSLRRILLSSLEGAAIMSCKIRGSNNRWIQHEYDILNNVKEDVMQIILNLKKIRLKMYSKGPETLTLKIKGEKTVVAGDIEKNPNVEILNPEQLIATLGHGGAIEMELEVGNGRGYSIAESNKKSHHSTDVIPIDSLFAPVKKVNYEIEYARVGQRTDYDKLIMEIWTDGSIMPSDALAYSSKILCDSLKVFYNSEKKEEKTVSAIEIIQQEKMIELLDQPVEILGLSSRPFNCLKENQVKTLRELVTKKEEEIASLRNLGKRSVDEIKDKLSEHNLSLGMQMKDIAKVEN